MRQTATLALGLCLGLSALPASAALSGFYDSAERIATILASPDVADALRQAPIGLIENTGTRKDGASEWMIRTQDCDLTVYLLAEPPKDGMVGKTLYRLDGISGCS